MSKAKSLKERRTNAGLTQQQLADLAGLKLSMIADIESERQLPSNETARKISAALAEARRQMKQKKGAQAVVDDLLPIMKIMEASEGLIGLKRSEVPEVLGRFQLARAVGWLPRAPQPLPSGNLARALTFKNPKERELAEKLGYMPDPVHLWIVDMLAKKRQVAAPAADSRKRQLSDLERLHDQGIDAPIIVELMESFRREITAKDEENEALRQALERAEKE